MRCGNRVSTNNVNICVNVNKGGSDFDNIAYLHDKITSLTSDINLLRANVSDLTSVEAFEQKLNNYFNFEEREKIKTLINDQSYETLKRYVTQYAEFSSLLDEGAKIKYKESDVYLNEFNSSSAVLITAQVDGETIVLNDVENTDHDDDTVYKFPIKGFILGIEIYCSAEDTSAKEKFENIKTSYDATTGISYVYLTHADYKVVYERGPNNKLKIYSLIIE